MDLNIVIGGKNASKHNGSVTLISLLQQSYLAVFKTSQYLEHHEERLATYVDNFLTEQEWYLNLEEPPITTVVINYVPDLEFGVRFVIYPSEKMLSFRSVISGKPYSDDKYPPLYQKAVDVFKDISSKLKLKVSGHETRNALLLTATGCIESHDGAYIYVEMAMSKDGKPVFR